LKTNDVGAEINAMYKWLSTHPDNFSAGKEKKKKRKDFSGVTSLQTVLLY
jgi:hypothetical protein